MYKLTLKDLYKYYTFQTRAIFKKMFIPDF